MESSAVVRRSNSSQLHSHEVPGTAASHTPQRAALSRSSSRGVIDTGPSHQMDQLIDELEAGFDPGHRALYAPHFAGDRRLVGKISQNAEPPDRVAAAVERDRTVPIATVATARSGLRRR
jgi:hypothetical protein